MVSMTSKLMRTMTNRYLTMLDSLSDERNEPVSDGGITLVIDGTNFFIRCFSAVPVINDNGDHIGGLLGFINSLGATIRNTNADRCILIFDAKGGSQRRRDLNPEYKGNRRGTRKFNRFDEFDDITREEQSFRDQFERVFQYLELLPIYVLGIENIEADDAIAYLATDVIKDGQIIIVSTDRDYYQLINDRVSVLNPSKKVKYTKENFQELIGVNLENYLLYRMLTGDGSDNLPGIPGLQKATLLKLYPDFNDIKYSSNMILEIAEQKVTEKKPKKVYQTILQYSDRIHMNEKLMQLHEVDISGSAKLKLIELVEQPLSLINRNKLRVLLSEDWIKINFDNWVRNFLKLELNVRKRAFVK